MKMKPKATEKETNERHMDDIREASNIFERIEYSALTPEYLTLKQLREYDGLLMTIFDHIKTGKVSMIKYSLDWKESKEKNRVISVKKDIELLEKANNLYLDKSENNVVDTQEVAFEELEELDSEENEVSMVPSSIG